MVDLCVINAPVVLPGINKSTTLVGALPVSQCQAVQ